MLRSVILCVSLLAFISAMEINASEPVNMNSFIKWMEKFGKKYESDNILKEKFQNFIANHFHVARLNRLHEGKTFFELNKFADMTAEEFQTQILMRSPMKASKAPTDKLFKPVEDVADLPESFDWRGKGAVTPIRDQGSVGSCWAFSAVQNLEGQWYQKTNNLLELSVEQVVDCNGFTQKNGTEACCGVYGGWPYLVFDYIKSAGGIEYEADYAYCSGLNKPCFPCGPPGYNASECGPAIPYCLLKDSCQAKMDPTKFVKDLKVVDWKQTSENETEIAKELMRTGPLSVALDATMLQFYHRGIFDPLLGCSGRLNHAVLMVGFGVEKSKPYWLIKNSWGEKWGEDGYFRILRNKGMCGINTQVTSAILG